MAKKIFKWTIIIALVFAIGIVLKAIKDVKDEETRNYNPYEKLGN